MSRLPSTLLGRLAAGTAAVGIVVVLLATTLRIAPWAPPSAVSLSPPSVLSSVAEFSLPVWEETAPAPSLQSLDIHPAQTLQPYFPPGARLQDASLNAPIPAFHTLLHQYAQRQGADDNFTVRVLDRRTDATLELYELADRRAQYQHTDTIDWREVDDQRRAVTDDLVDKYEAQGIPIDDITVRWGRANQVQKAHQRDAPFAAYEIQLARTLGLSLLATEIGTVETFNQDHLVSGAGARSRYQMMPWLLRKGGVNQYQLYTKGGAPIAVQEELHPLLTLEPAFLLLRGYVNAVGHEIPGLSAYHTGPGNIFRLYRLYYTESQHFSAASTVADAYAWALTEGFDTVREGSTFGPYSRRYVPSLHGSLQANRRGLPDSAETMRAARVQVRPTASVTLDRLLTTLDSTDQALHWGPVADEPTTYHRFRALNPHLDLPDAASPTGGVPATGNVRLVSSTDGKRVRFFLPPEAPSALYTAGLDVLAPGATLQFDDTTYAPPSDEQKTIWDRQYAALVDDIAHFGFTPKNRERLLSLHDRFERLAADTPSPYRRRQLDIIQTHRRLWLSGPWKDLSDLTMQVTGRVPTQPPAALSLPDPPTPYQLDRSGGTP